MRHSCLLSRGVLSFRLFYRKIRIQDLHCTYDEFVTHGVDIYLETRRDA